jgi:hypothetical protein
LWASDIGEILARISDQLHPHGFDSIVANDFVRSLKPCAMNHSIPWTASVQTVLLLASSDALAGGWLFGGRNARRHPAPCLPLAVEVPPALSPPLPLVPETKKPDPLVPSEGNVLLFSYRASGVQIYQCQVKKGDATEFEWELKGPEVILYDSRDDDVGSHTAVPLAIARRQQNCWREDGSRRRPRRSLDPLVLLWVESHAGTGVFDKVSYIHCVETWRGLGPSTGATKENAGKLVLVK